MKTKEELNALKSELEALSEKLAELTEEELAAIAGGDDDYPHREVFDYLHYSDNGIPGTLR